MALIRYPNMVVDKDVHLFGNDDDTQGEFKTLKRIQQRKMPSKTKSYLGLDILIGFFAPKGCKKSHPPPDAVSINLILRGYSFSTFLGTKSEISKSW